MKSLELKKDIYWVGSLDPNLRIFDIIMETEFGTTYNSYIVKGSEKIALFETVKVKYFNEYLEKIKEFIDPRKIDYIVVDHTEPDHAGSVEMLLDYATNAKIVGSQAAIDFLREIANRDFDAIVVNHGDTLNLGNKTLKFVSAPFLHWPDSIYTYIPEDKILVTCDSFGSHYSWEEVLFSKIPQEKMKDYESALLYYYTAIFGPFKEYVLQALDKIKDFDIEMIATGHGPVLDKNPQIIMDTYRKWSTETNPNNKKTIVIPYVSAYGYTEELAKTIAEGIKSQGDFNIKMYNLNIANYGGLKQEIMNEIYWAEGILLGTSTINGDALPPIWDIATSLNPIVHGGKIVSAFGSYGWSGEAVPNIIARLDQLRMKVVEGYSIKFKPSPYQIDNALTYGKNFAKYILEGNVPPRNKEEIDMITDLNPSGEIKKWRCVVCGEIFEGILPPQVCPACGVGQEMFEIVEDNSLPSFVKNTEEKYIVVGNGAAGIAAADAIRTRNNSATIEIITKEDCPAYYRPSLSDYISGEINEKDFYLRDDSWYKEKNIQVIYGVNVDDIKPTDKLIKLSNGETKNYDKLILANGSRGNIPPILGVEKTGTFVLRSKKDADRIKEYAKEASRVVVIGGGILGLEAASELKSLGLNVTIVEMASRIFPRQLDEEASALFEEIVSKKDIKIYKNHFVKAIGGKTKVESVELDNGKEIKADMVLISAGIKANTQITIGSPIMSNYGIIVDDTMLTSEKDIYACGDVAEYKGMVTGLWATALDQGNVAGANATGDNLVYKPSIQPVTFSGLDTNIFSIGDIGSDPDKDYGVSVYDDKKNGVYKKLYFSNGKFVGGILCGDISKAPALLNAIKTDTEMKDLVKKVF